jgi:hypothetical protein
LPIGWDGKRFLTPSSIQWRLKHVEGIDADLTAGLC